MTEKSFDSAVQDALARIEERIENACVRAGRSREDVRLMAVTKTVEAERINCALEAGVSFIGENRVQEFLAKKQALLPGRAEIHLIGHLQSNKVNSIVGQVDMIQSVDSEALARKISRRSEELGIVTRVLAEVNIGGEEAKSGITPEGLEELLGQMALLPGISVEGLMTVPPISEKESEKRAFFSKMYQLQVDMRAKNIDNIDMRILSMGMSDDFEEAILEGATLVRIGSAIFGRRQYV